MKKIQRQGIVYGGDYNPEQWDPSIWNEDIRLMQEAGVNMVSLGIFSWALLQPAEDRFDFSFLDDIMNRLYRGGIGVDLATSTASQPAWLSRKYDDILPVDEKGIRYAYGSRQSYCPNSSSWRKAAGVMARKMAERYKDHPGLKMWHINNEYACHVRVCYCENCARAFRTWLQKKYGSVEEVNRSWGTRFWSQYYYEWEEILPPRATTAQKNPGQVLDYQRFMSDSLLDCYLLEKKILEEESPDVEITTNFMMEWKPQDYYKWAKEIDVISWDSYPDPSPSYRRCSNALDHDIMRGIKEGKPFLLMEQAPNQVNWRPVNRTKGPGLMRLYSYQALAHGADGVLFFQWRQSRRGAEKFHSGCITHTGDNRSRVFKEVARLGNELKKLKDLQNSRIDSKVCLIIDYENWWALEYDFRQSHRIEYREILLHYYAWFHQKGVSVDIRQGNEDLSRYALVLAPSLYLLKKTTAENLREYTRRGGHLLLTFSSALVDEEDAVFDEGYLGGLRQTAGITLEEFDVLGEGDALPLIRQNRSVDMQGDLWIDSIHLDQAEAVLEYRDELGYSHPAVTVNRCGEGCCWYLGTQLIGAGFSEFMQDRLRDAGIEHPWKLPDGVEMGQRVNDAGTWTFLMNFNIHSVEILLPKGPFTHVLFSGEASGRIRIPPRETVVLLG